MTSTTDAPAKSDLATPTLNNKLQSDRMPQSIAAEPNTAQAKSCRTRAGLTLITSRHPKRLTKQFRLEDGELRKEPGGNLCEGTAEIVHVTSVKELQVLINGMKENQALTYGVPKRIEQGMCRVTTRAQWEAEGSPEGTITRTNEDFDFQGPGVMFLDYDPHGNSICREELLCHIRTAAPWLEDVEMLWIPSSSSHITNDKEDLTGLRGQRLYFLVSDATQIPRIGELIYASLWAEGLGHIEISSSGAMLERTLVDRDWETPSSLPCHL